MNREQRRTLERYAQKLTVMSETYDEIKTGVEAIKEEEEQKQENTCNLNEELAERKYEEYQECIDVLDEAIDMFDEINFIEIAEQLRSV